MSDKKFANTSIVDVEEYDKSAGSFTEETYIKTNIGFKKSRELFFTTKAPPSEPRQKFFFWYPPGQSAEEKKLVFKVDFLIMSYVCLSYFCRYLDAANVTNAYISGMKEDLNISGAQYVYLTQLFNAAYCASGLFSTVLFTKLKFSTLFPFIEITWGLLTLFIFKAKDFKTVACLRFFQGLCEGTAWPAIHFILGSWYTPQELGKRASLYTSCGIAGTLLSGIISSGLIKSMDGRHGIKGWQWLFIVDGIITIPIACLGFFVPSTPEQMTPNKIFSEREVEIAVERTKVNGKKRINKLDWTTFKRVLTSYQWYVFVFMWCLWSFCGVLQQQFGIVLKALHYSVYNSNKIPAGTSGVGILASLLTGFLIDLRGGRIEIALFLQTLFVVGAILVKVYDISRAALFFGFMIQGVLPAAISPLVVGWCNELTKEDTQLRAITIGSLNFFGGLIAIPFNIFLFNTDLAPRFEKGALATMIIGIGMWFFHIVIWWCERYQKRKRAYIFENERTFTDKADF